MKTKPGKSLYTIIVILFSSFLLLSCTSEKKTEETTDEATMPETAQPPAGDWIILFDGESFDGWKRFNADNIGNLWRIEDGVIACYSQGGEEASNEGGALTTTEQFGNFELSLEWKISEGGNSGIMYHVVENQEYQYAYETGPEYQLVDDENFSDDDLKPEQKTAANYDMYAPSEDKELNPPGEWNSTKIIYSNGHVEHWLNGEKVLEFEEGSEEWQQRYQDSKWTEYPGWSQFAEGAIALQDHGSPIWFRNIKIKRL